MADSSVLTHEGYLHDKPWDSGHLSVGSIHQIYYEQYGKRDGKPVLFLHGGPGSGCRFEQTSYFDPNIYRVILHDQRGAGKSTPVAELRENTSHHLVSDIEALRKRLDIAKWAMVFGGSWGSTLALLYSETHPESVGSLVVQGVFTARKSEIEFCSGSTGSAHIFPEGYDEFVGFLPPEEREDVFGSYYKRMISEDYETRLRASQAYNRWELLIGQLVPDPAELEMVNDEKWSLQHGRMELHYDVHKAWLEEGQLLKPENTKKIAHIPCTIIQGRYDLCCPARTAWELHKALPSSRLFMIPTAGHDPTEPGTRQKLLETCDEYGAINFN